MNKILAFDMDGTIANLYGVENWLEKLRAEDATPYRDAKPLWDMAQLREILLKLAAAGWEIRVISWLSKNSTEAYKAAVREVKKEWLARYNFPAKKVHLIAYGTTKADCIRRYKCPAVLIDDNATVRNGWHLGETINPTEGNLIEELKKLLK